MASTNAQTISSLARFDVAPFARRPERGSHKPAQGNALGDGADHPSSSPERAKQPVRSEDIPADLSCALRAGTEWRNIETRQRGAQTVASKKCPDDLLTGRFDAALFGLCPEQADGMPPATTACARPVTTHASAWFARDACPQTSGASPIPRDRHRQDLARSRKRRALKPSRKKPRQEFSDLVLKRHRPTACCPRFFAPWRKRILIICRPTHRSHEIDTMREFVRA